MQILIVDDINSQRGFSDSLKNHPEVVIQNNNFTSLDFSNCKIIFKHDTFNHQLATELKEKIIFINFSGGGTLKNEMLDDAAGFKFRATIETPEQINKILSIINKEEFSREDMEMILNFDKKLEDLLEEFKNVLPLKEYWMEYLGTNHLCEVKKQLYLHLNLPLEDFRCM